jgi:hypothetical protein
MQRYMIEVAHEHTYADCVRVLDTFLTYGSHFVTHADWGCMAGDHTAWVIIEATDEAEARQVLPPVFRPKAKVVKLNKFTPEQIREMRRQWQEQRRQGA